MIVMIFQLMVNVPLVEKVKFFHRIKKACANENNGYVSYKADGTCINVILDFSWLKIKINVFMDVKMKELMLM